MALPNLTENNDTEPMKLAKKNKTEPAKHSQKS